jgi:hypothetical protein
MTILRRLRAAAVLAVAWGILWVPFGIALQLVLVIWVMPHFPTWRDAWHLVLQGTMAGAVWGLASGALFSLALAAAERRGAVERLAGARVVLWGALSGVAFPIVMIALLMAQTDARFDDIIGPFVLMGAGLAYGALVGSALLSAARSGSPAEAA